MADKLDKIIGGVDKHLHESSTPFSKNKEKTTSVQIRNSTYNKLRWIAFKKRIPVVDLTDKAVRYAIKHNIL